MRGTIEVHRHLTERGVPHEFYRLERPLRRIDEAAALLGLDPQIVVSPELFETGSQRILAITPASMCASSDGVARALGTQRVRPMSKARTVAHTGFLAEWLPPVGHERPSAALIDASLAGADVLYAPGGDPGVMLVLPSRGLVRATSAEVASLAAPADLEEVRPAAAPGLR